MYISFKKAFLKKKILCCIFFFTTFIYTQPKSEDYLRVGAELCFFSYTQFLHHPPQNKSKISSPNNFDSYVREKIHWGSSKHGYASGISDMLLYGAFVGAIPLSSIYLKNHEFFLINLEILSINGLITNIVKNVAQRQRPYSFYSEKDDKDSYKSFFSGHTSTAFAIGTSTAKMLTNYSDLDKRIVWISALGMASATGYFRIAADKHYFSDVFVGAIVGSLIGDTMFDKLTRKYQKTSILGERTPKLRYNSQGIRISIAL